ncbi:MAG: FtsB family cell division protein [Magnetovibrionaceae bacterium]
MQALGPLAAAGLIIYFSVHALTGDRGWLAHRTLLTEVERTRTLAEATGAQRSAWEDRIRLLHPDSLDPDMLDEQARLMLNYAEPGEIVILTPGR